MALHRHVSALIGRLNLVDDVVDVEFDPWRREHVVDEVVFSESPVLGLFFELEPYHLVVGVHHRVHVRVETLQSVHGGHVELYLNLVVRIRSDHKVHIIPITQE